MLIQPSAKPLTSISPTFFNEAMECRLKAVWQANGNPPLLPRSPKTWVGSVVHRLLSEAGSARLPPQEDAINHRWEQLIAQAHASIASSAVEKHLSPLTRSVPDINVRRIRATRRAQEIAQRSTPRATSSTNPVSVPPYGHEIPLRSRDYTVRGIIDAALHQASDRTTIQDFKSGPVMETDEDGTTQPRTSYQVQLKIYAALYAETFDRWPDSLQLVSLAGTPTDVAFDPSECLSLVDQAKTMLQEINASISRHAPETVQSTLANPSPNACRFCPYRPGCPPYRSARTIFPTTDWPNDLIGIVEQVTRLGNSKIMLELTIGNNSVKIPRLSPGTRHPFLAELDPGDRAGAFNLYRPRPQSPFSETVLTTIYPMSAIK